jgi:chemosensory pili system protein ChpA (sensor histidine kinase/response regulator)
MKKILVIEDDPVVATVYRRFLEGNGFQIDIATDGAKGLERMTSFAPDAVVLDLMMPKMNGIDVLKNLRAREAHRDLPVIVLTNACIPAFVEQAMQAGANYVMDKSKDTPSSILAAIQRLLDTVPDTLGRVN